MKGLILGLAGFISVVSWTACQRANAFVDLETGETVKLEKDPETGAMVNVETGKPVRLYVNKSSRDTFYGPTGEIVNNKLRLKDDGTYVYSGEMKRKSGDDGEYKIKDGDYKEKYEDGEYKVKDGDYKKKVEADGDVKIKNGDQKIKIDGETGDVKVK
jgi:hypothetical protein